MHIYFWRVFSNDYATLFNILNDHSKQIKIWNDEQKESFFSLEPFELRNESKKYENERKITFLKSITVRCDWCVWSPPVDIVTNLAKKQTKISHRISLITWNLNTMDFWRDKRCRRGIWGRKSESEYFKSKMIVFRGFEILVLLKI